MGTRKIMTFEELSKMYREFFGEFELLQTYGNSIPISYRHTVISRGIYRFPKEQGYYILLHEFLQYYFSLKWKSQLPKHALVDWMNNFSIRTHLTHDEVILSGLASAYLRFANDLFIIDQKLVSQNGINPGLGLQKTFEILFDKLADAKDFQSARHELFGAAIMVRAGFDIEFVNEASGKGSKPEFIAIKDGIKIGIEAKSRRRNGSYSTPGVPQADEEIVTVAKDIIENALNKNFEYPKIIFIDLNLPVSEFQFFNRDLLFKQLKLETREAKENIRASFNAIVFTNTPDVYGGETKIEVVTHKSENPKYALDESIIDKIILTTAKAVYMPSDLNFFPSVARIETMNKMCGK